MRKLSISINERKHRYYKHGSWRIISKTIWIALIHCAIFLYLLNVFFIQTYITSLGNKHLSIGNNRPDQKRLQFRGFLVKNAGCLIPNLDPFDPSIRSLIFEISTPKCNRGLPALYNSSLSSIFLVHSALPYYGIKSIAKLWCCYTPFWRRRPADNKSDTEIRYDRQCLPIGNKSYIDQEFIRVTCIYRGRSIYTDYFSFVPLKRYSLKSLQTVAPLNVLIVGLDSVSRTNLYRQMPNTVKYLHSLSAVDLLGYNKVADNTFSNLIPVLTGHFERELEGYCCSSTKYFDDGPFVWKLYKKLGFVTSYGEDGAATAIFQHGQRGFRKQPTDYMWTVFDREAEAQIGNRYLSRLTPLCVGSRLVYRTSTKYVDDFVETMHRARQRYFAFHWSTSLGHDFFNMPQIGDDHYRALFERLSESGRLNNTALFFISDHGFRWGEVRQTYQGRMEEMLPFVFIVLPSWFRAKYPKSYRRLKINAKQLTTPFDLHETLAHLTNFTESADDWLTGQEKHGYSLFKNISPMRTCQDARIPVHYCACQHSLEVKRNNSIVLYVAAAIVDHMNGQLKGYAQCAKLALKAVLEARVVLNVPKTLMRDDIYKDYTLTILTDPGDGIFESTVRHHVGRNGTGYEITGTVSRLNLYGTQSHCIEDTRLKLYCFCKS